MSVIYQTAIYQTIKETEDNGVHFECNIIGDGTEENPYRPECFDTHPTGYYHFDKRKMDLNTKKCKMIINKKRTKAAIIQQIKTDPKFTVEKETSEGAVIGEQ